MAVKASITITISCYRDTNTITRYYKLQASTAQTPAKPSTLIPSGWNDTEPSYTSGSTNTLYFVDRYIFSDGTFQYTEVSRSTSYEAAKEAYNKAQAAQNSIDNMEIGGRNYIRYGKGDVKEGFFQNAVITDEGAQFEWQNTSSSAWTNVSIYSGYTIYQRDFIPGKKLTMSYDIKYILWDIPDGVTIGEHWLGGRYGNPSWKGITQFVTPLVGQNNCELNEWYHYTGSITVPPLLDSSVPVEMIFRFQFKNGIGHIKAIMKNVKLEYGDKPTDWTPAPEDVNDSIENIQIGGTNLIEGTKNQDTSKGNFRNSVTETNEYYMGCRVFKSNGAWADIGTNLQRLINKRYYKIR